MERNKWLKQEIMTRMEDADVIKALQADAYASNIVEISVIFDDKKITCCCSDGEMYEMGWHELVGVAIETSDKGPFFEDVFWYLGAKDRSLCIPQSARGFCELLNRLQRLPEFNNQALANAMVCTENKLFVCWQRKK